MKIDRKENKKTRWTKKDAKNPMNRNETTAGFVYIYRNENNEHLNREE